MSKARTVHVSSAQKQAAQGLVNRSVKSGRHVSSSVAKIANAKSSSRRADSGRLAGGVSTSPSSDADGAGRQ